MAKQDPSKAPSEVLVSTELLSAVAKWSKNEDDHHLAWVHIRLGEMYATDSHRLVRIPMMKNQHFTASIHRRDIFAAAAAQRELRTSEMMRIRDDLPAIRLMRIGDRVQLVLSTMDRVVLDVPAGTGEPHTRAQLDAVTSVTQHRTSPDGYGLNPAYLAAIHEIREALRKDAGRSAVHDVAVRVTGWGVPDKDGMFAEPIRFECCGAVLAIMPMRGGW